MLDLLKRVPYVVYLAFGVVVILVALAEIALPQGTPPPPTGMYSYAFFGVNEAGSFVPISIDAAHNMLTASGAGFNSQATPPRGMYSAAVFALMPDGVTYAPVHLDATGAVIVSGSGGGGMPLPAGATADYSFLQGSGTTLTDSSGNGNNGTLGAGALAPVWNAVGLTFSGQQQVALPAALNGTETFFLAVYINPVIVTAQLSNSFPMLVGASNGTPGLNLLMNQIVNGNQVPGSGGGSYVQSISANSTFTTSGTNSMSGFHVLAYVLGTGSGNLDHLYIDGVEQPAYVSQGSSAGIQTTGHFFLGSSNTDLFTGSGFLGTMYRVVMYPVNTLTASQIQLISGSIRSDVQTRGVAVTPQPIPQNTATLNCIGDSITFGFGATTPYCSELTLTGQPTYTITNWGVNSITVAVIEGSEPNRVAPRCSSIHGPANALVFAGTNDFADVANIQAPSIFANLAGEIQVLKLAGCRVFIGTMLSRGGNAGPGTFDQAKNAYDALILTQAISAGADAVVDFAANPLLGADGANANATYFNSDNIHPTTAGQALLATAFSNVLNYTYGFNRSNPDVVTATTYQMLAGDGAVTAAPTANAAYTAPDCVGPSGVDYVISNPQSTFTVTVTGQSGQPINGLATAITVPANGALTLHDVANPKTVSGCHWTT